MTSKTFDPVAFIGKEWSIESDNGVNPADLSGVVLKHFLKDGEDYITGDEILERQKGEQPLNADAFLRLWENQELIPKEWYPAAEKGYIEFSGTVLRSSYGRRVFLFLYRSDGGSWDWHYFRLDFDRDRQDVSPHSTLTP